MQALSDGEAATRKSWISYGLPVLFLLAMKLTIAAAGMDVGGFAVIFSWPWLLGVSAAGCWECSHLPVPAWHPCGTPKSAISLAFLFLR